MCDLCRQTPCNSLCPHADEPQGTKCDDCGEVIYLGDDYVDVNGKKIHLTCIKLYGIKELLTLLGYEIQER